MTTLEATRIAAGLVLLIAIGMSVCSLGAVVREIVAAWRERKNARRST